MQNIIIQLSHETHESIVANNKLIDECWFEEHKRFSHLENFADDLAMYESISSFLKTVPAEVNTDTLAITFNSSELMAYFSKRLPHCRLKLL